MFNKYYGKKVEHDPEPKLEETFNPPKEIRDNLGKKYVHKKAKYYSNSQF